MDIDSRWIAVAATTAVGVAGASHWRRRHHRAVHNLQHKTDLKTWENEGGTVMPPPAAPALP